MQIFVSGGDFEDWYRTIALDVHSSDTILDVKVRGSLSTSTRSQIRA